MPDATIERVRGLIREVPDFPKPGINFKDIAPLLLDEAVFSETVDRMVDLASEDNIHKVVAPEARGFIFGAPVAIRLGSGLIPVRKPGKLPYETTSVTYALEYGEDTVCMHTDAVNPGDRVLLIDDVLATGGTMRACADLVESRGGIVVSCLVLMELSFLNGRDLLKDYRVRSLIRE